MAIGYVDGLYVCTCVYCGWTIAKRDKKALKERLRSLGWMNVNTGHNVYCKDCYPIAREKQRKSYNRMKP